MDDKSLEAISNLTDALRAVEGALHSFKKELRHIRKKGAGPEVDVPEAEFGVNARADTLDGSPGRPSRAELNTFPRRSSRISDRLDGQVTVHVRVLFVKIGEIDTIRETFNADVLIQARWQEPSLNGKTQEELDMMNLEDIWDPSLYVENILTEHHEHGSRQAAIENGTVIVTETKRIKGTFVENMELRRFPFDTQELSVTLTAERPASQVELVNDNSECLEHVQSFVEKQEWSLHRYVEWRLPNKSAATREPDPDCRRPLQPRISIYCQARRRPGFFVFNILLVVIFISSMSFTTFAVEASNVFARLKLSFTLMLTMVTFKFTVNRSLPKISYLTYLDTYVLTSMGVLGCICVWHAVVTIIFNQYDAAAADVADEVALIAFSCIYISFNVVYFSIIALQTRFTSRIQERKDAAFMERHNKLPSHLFNFRIPHGLHTRIVPKLN